MHMLYSVHVMYLNVISLLTIDQLNQGNDLAGVEVRARVCVCVCVCVFVCVCVRARSIYTLYVHVY